MRAAAGWAVLCLCVGCQSVDLTRAMEKPPSSPAEQFWETGQNALKQGKPEDAVVWFQQALDADPHMSRAHLSLAAAYLESGDESAACPHLAAYLDANPNQMVVRGHYAELLWRLHRLPDAREQFNRFDASAQNMGESGIKHLVHCHSRLMEICEAQEDEYGEHLHRGIGLYYLAKERSGGAGEDGDCSPESLLCKAAAELTLARLHRSGEARPCWYLYEVWNTLEQRQPALRNLQLAQRAAPFTELTPHEQNGLELAHRLRFEKVTEAK